MQPQEKKYLVDSFTGVEKKLEEVGAKKGKEVVAVHYYGQHESNDVEKFVECADRVEIHFLKETNGKFTLTEHSPIVDKEMGMVWLKRRGYTTANIVKMVYTEYAYKGGMVGLYIIDDFLHSVILYFPPDQHKEMEKKFGLGRAEQITVPYNKYLEKFGKLRSMPL